MSCLASLVSLALILVPFKGALAQGPGAMFQTRARMTDSQSGIDEASVVACQAIQSDSGAGDLDPGFGAGGVVLTNIQANSTDFARGAGLQPDGKLVVVGRTDVDGDLDIAMIRYHQDGSLDSSFGDLGIVVTDVFGFRDEAQAVAIGADGKIVVVGYASTGLSARDFFVARFAESGDLDPSFGASGITTTDLGGQDEAKGVALLPSGEILVVGTHWGATYDVAIAKYMPSGNLDGSFGAGGVVTADFEGGTDSGNGLAVQQDGKIIVVGTSYRNDDTGNDFLVARYNASGSADASFGSGGYVTTDFGTGSRELANGVALQPDGKIVVVGSSNADGESDFALARYQVNGALDETIGAAGLVSTDFGAGLTSYAQDVLLLPTGHMVASGYSSWIKPDETYTYDFAAAVYDFQGELEVSVGSGGMIVLDLGSESYDRAFDALWSEGRLQLFGYSDAGSDLDFAAAAFYLDLALFADSFEAGNTSAWSSTVN